MQRGSAGARNGINRIFDIKPETNTFNTFMRKAGVSEPVIMEIRRDTQQERCLTATIPLTLKMSSRSLINSKSS
jgi:hypothetical protein